MQAIVQTAYGSPQVALEMREIDRPIPEGDEILVRVKAASIHSGDFFGVKGSPFVARFFIGLPRPRRDYVVGADACGVVEAVGSDVTRFEVGDEVFGETGHGCAEYTCASEERFARKPTNLACTEAATAGVSAVTALQGLRDAGGLRAGEHALINGASGGVGTFAVQIAKALGAEVTGVCSTRNVELVRSIGADHVIDYTKDDYTKGGPRFDLILDNVANHPLSASRSALSPDGRLVPNSGHSGLGYIAKAALSAMFVKQQVAPFVTTGNYDDLDYLRQLMEDRSVRPVIDSTYPIGQAAEAFEQLGAGHVRGKLVLDVEGVGSNEKR
jgi:NADPH:quinone reductase-like Zn-dependent oxidoreductase